MNENEKKPENIKAFPMYYGHDRVQQGMTLRDYFANSAMQSIVGGGLNVKNEEAILEAYDYVAKNAYLFADAMLKQREL
jgi:hypothetical protein